MSAPARHRRRVRIVASALGVGLFIGAVAVSILSVVRTPTSGQATVFSLGALALGFGTLGWSSSIMFGTGIENAQRHLDTGTDWNEADSRRAMARIAAFGAGVMCAVPLVAFVPV